MEAAVIFGLVIGALFIIGFIAGIIIFAQTKVLVSRVNIF